MDFSSSSTDLHGKKVEIAETSIGLIGSPISLPDWKIFSVLLTQNIVEKKVKQISK